MPHQHMRNTSNTILRFPPVSDWAVVFPLNNGSFKKEKDKERHVIKMNIVHKHRTKTVIQFALKHFYCLLFTDVIYIYLSSSRHAVNAVTVMQNPAKSLSMSHVILLSENVLLACKPEFWYHFEHQSTLFYQFQRSRFINLSLITLTWLSLRVTVNNA